MLDLARAEHIAKRGIIPHVCAPCLGMSYLAVGLSLGARCSGPASP